MRLSKLLRSKRQRGRHKQTVYRSFHVHSAVTSTAVLATGTNRAVFSSSKVCQDALFIKHKYAQDDYNWLNLQNQVSNVGKITVIMAKLRWVRLLHKCHRPHCGCSSIYFRENCVAVNYISFRVLFFQRCVSVAKIMYSSGIHTVVFI